MAEYGSGTTITGRSQADIIFRISTGGIFDFVNKAVTNLGWNPPDLIGKPLTAIIHPEHETAANNFIRNSGDQLNQPMDRAQTAELPVVLVPQEWKKTKSEAACMKGSMVLLGEIASSRYAAYDKQSGASLPKLLVGLITDITPGSQSGEELARDSRLESLGILAAGVAHDFNNFLTGIYGNLQLANCVSGIPGEAREYLDVVFKSFDLAKTLTHQFQSLVLSSAPARSIVAVTDIIDDACSLSFCGSSIRCIKQAGETRHAIQANRGQMVRLFCNLLLNARHAMGDQGIVEVSLSRKTVTAVKGAALLPGLYETVAIRDQGPGIPASDLARIFTPFFTTRPGGWGMGLPTAHAIARDHGGTIIVSSVQGQGSTFTVYLPSVVGMPAEISPSPGSRARSKETGRVLVVDADEVVRDVVNEMLSRAGYETVAVASGEHALNACRQAIAEGNPFDIAILDLTVPGAMGGENVGRLLRRHDPQLRAIAFSGYLPERESAALREPFSDFIAKPFLYEELLQKVGAACEAKKAMITGSNPPRVIKETRIKSV
jgi:signal transduction histidine kinase/CheY-like chemotaxis protein